MMGVPQLRRDVPPYPGFDRPRVVVQTFQSDPEDTERSTAHTIALMSRLIARAVGDPYVCGLAKAIPFRSRGALAVSGTILQQLPAAARQKGTLAIAAWHWVKDFIRFEEDQKLIARLGGDPEALELLTEPSVLVREVSPRGDCDCFTMLVCALLQCLGVEWDIVTVACSRRLPGVWSHVFPRAHLGENFALPLDASHGKFPGWHVPSRDIQRTQIWNRYGEPAGQSAQEEVI